MSAIASFLIESVGEHVTAFLKTITEPVESIACWTCVRSMLESSSIAAWLFEPDIDAKTRVGRGFAHRFEGMVQQVKFLKAMKRPAAEVKALEDHINDVENVAVGLGFTRVKNTRGDRIGICQVMPSATDIIKLMLDEELAYRLLSAVAHGHTWAIQKLGFKEAAVPMPPTSGVAVTAFEKHSGTIEGYCYLATRAAKSLGLPIWYWCLYFGWDKCRLTAALEATYDEMKATPAIRFWR